MSNQSLGDADGADASNKYTEIEKKKKETALISSSLQKLLLYLGRKT